MEWILDHLQLVIAAIIIGAYLLRAVKRRAPEEQPGDVRAPAPETDHEEAERTRRLQEEIRRRILARQRGEEPQPSGPVVIFDDEEDERPPIPVAPAARPPPIPRAPEPDHAMAAMLERQRALAEQMRLLETTRAYATAAVPRLSPGVSTASVASPGGPILASLRHELSGARNLRKAVLLREILGEAPGLRRGMPVFPRR